MTISEPIFTLTSLCSELAFKSRKEDLFGLATNPLEAMYLNTAFASSSRSVKVSFTEVLDVPVVVLSAYVGAVEYGNQSCRSDTKRTNT